MTRQEVQSILAEENPEALFYDGFDEAIIGIARRSGMAVVAYDQNRCYQKLIADGMSFEEAADYFEFNVIGSYLGEHTPVFVDFS